MPPSHGNGWVLGPSPHPTGTTSYKYPRVQQQKGCTAPGALGHPPHPPPDPTACSGPGGRHGVPPVLGTFHVHAGPINNGLSPAPPSRLRGNCFLGDAITGRCGGTCRCWALTPASSSSLAPRPGGTPGALPVGAAVSRPPRAPRAALSIPFPFPPLCPRAPPALGGLRMEPPAPRCPPGLGTEPHAWGNTKPIIWGGRGGDGEGRGPPAAEAVWVKERWVLGTEPWLSAASEAWGNLSLWLREVLTQGGKRITSWNALSAERKRDVIQASFLPARRT